MVNLAISALASSTKSADEPLAEREVNGVEPPLVLEAPGVEVPVVDPPAEAFLAAFSARRFCLDAEGAIVSVCVRVSERVGVRVSDRDLCICPF